VKADDIKKEVKANFYRPIQLIALFLASGVVVSFLFYKNSGWTFVVLGGALLWFIIMAYYTKRIKALVLMLLFFALGFAIMNNALAAEAMPEAKGTITGQVVDVKVYDESVYLTLDNWQIQVDDEVITPSKRLNVIVDYTAAICGDTVLFHSKIKLPDGKRNFYGFDQQLYLASKQIAYYAYPDELTIVGHQQNLNAVFYQIRTYANDTLEMLYDKDTVGIAKGFFLSDKTDIEDADYQAFKTSGAASILAVSGLHFGIISIVFFWLLTKIGVGRRSASITTAVMMFFYAGVVGFTASALRALVMGVIVIVAELLGKRKDYLSFISLAFVISLILRPASLFSAGFLMSFGAVYAIVLLAPFFQRCFKPIPRFLSSTMAATFGATLGVSPFVINFFNYVSIIGVFSNIIIMPLGSLAVVLVFLSVVLGSLLGQPIAFLAQWLIKGMIWFMSQISSVPFAAVTMKNLPIVFVMGWFLLIFVLSNEIHIKKWFKRVLSALLVSVLVITLALPAFVSPKLSVYFLDVGQGDCALIETQEGKHYLIDTGRVYAYDEIERYLVSSGIVLDGLFLTHPDADHIGGAQDLIDAGFVSELYIANTDWVSYDFMGDYHMTYLKKGDTVILSDTVSLSILHPPSSLDTEDKNQRSLCMVLESDVGRVLFTGDIDDIIENELLSALEDVDVLKVSHHGSKYGSTPQFLSAIEAEYAVIQCGENIYGHPAEETLYHLKRACDIIYRTDLDGGIRFTFGESISVKTVIEHFFDDTF
jgi:competence protein ComEC